MLSRQILFRAFLICGCTTAVLAAPPVPTLDDNEPGLKVLFSGDPDTTEDGCAADGPRSG